MAQTDAPGREGIAAVPADGKHCAGGQAVRRAGRFDRDADAVGVQFPLKDRALYVLDAEVQDVRDGVFRAVDTYLRVLAQGRVEFRVPLLDRGRAFRQIFYGKFQCTGQRRRQRHRRGAASIDGGALAAVDERLQCQIPPLEQQADAVQAIEFVSRQAHGVHPFKRNGDLSNSLGGIDMQVAVGVVLQDGGDLLHRLHDAEFAVYQRDRHGDGVRPQQIFQMVKVYSSVPPDVQQVDLIALLLQRSQSAADGRMLQWGGDDVPARMAGEPGQPLEREVVGFAGTGGIDDLGRLYAQQSGNLQRGSVDLGSGGVACLMMGVGVADAAPLYGAEPVEYLRVGRCIGGIIQIDHWVSLNFNPFNRYYYSARGAGLQDAGAKCCRRGIKPEKKAIAERMPKNRKSIAERGGF